jgi:glutamate-1-semialdehyde 2,1-aminomutase
MAIKSTAISDSLYQKAKNMIAGAANGAPQILNHAKASLFIERGSGSRLYDADGNEYVDMCRSSGSLILGHANHDVIEAVSRAVADGLSAGTYHRKEIEIAELILSGLSEFDSVRFFNGATDASSTALRQAMRFTGRDLIVIFDGGRNQPGDFKGARSNRDILNGNMLSGEFIWAQYDDEDSFERLLKNYSDRIAAVLVEPLPAENGLLVQRKEFLKFVRELTWKSGAILIFNETVSAFRIHFGGYYQLINIVPDIVILGNNISNGMSVGAIVGLDSVMRLLTVQEYPTATANPVALSAGVAVLNQLISGDVYGKLDRLGRKFASLLKECKIPYANFQQVGSILWPHLDTGEFPRIPRKISPVSLTRFNRMYRGILKNGFFVSSSAYDPMFFSGSHCEEDIERFVSVIVNELSKMESV